MEPTINNNPALKISELMTRWQCCRKTVLDAIKAGRLNAFKPAGNHWRIPLDEVLRFESDQKGQPS